MTYYESAEGIEIDEARVIKELKDHGCDPVAISEFFDEVRSFIFVDGGKETKMWDAQDVLRWLHY